MADRPAILGGPPAFEKTFPIIRASADEAATPGLSDRMHAVLQSNVVERRNLRQETGGGIGTAAPRRPCGCDLFLHPRLDSGPPGAWPAREACRGPFLHVQRDRPSMLLDLERNQLRRRGRHADRRHDAPVRPPGKGRLPLAWPFVRESWRCRGPRRW